MSNVFEQAQQLFTAEFAYWAEQARSYNDIVTQEFESNVKLVQEAAEKGQAALERMVKKSDAMRRDFDTRATALLKSLTELKAA